MARDWTGADGDGDERRRDCAETGRLQQPSRPQCCWMSITLMEPEGTVWHGARVVPVLCSSTQTRIKHSLTLTTAALTGPRPEQKCYLVFTRLPDALIQRVLNEQEG